MKFFALLFASIECGICGVAIDASHFDITAFRCIAIFSSLAGAVLWAGIFLDEIAKGSRR
jgi:hypothetical protein